MSDYLLRNGCMVMMIPFLPARGVKSQSFARELDGLVLQGGADVSPSSYNEKPIRQEWEGDLGRDLYECDLIKAFFYENKPILGICRGMQILNVCFGGSLYQDINYSKPEAFVHRDANLYERNNHRIQIVAGSRLSKLYGGKKQAVVNSVHHQAVKDLAKGFLTEANSYDDGIIEAIYLAQKSPEDPYCYGVQWHPEFQAGSQHGFLDPDILLRDFLDAVEHRH